MDKFSRRLRTLRAESGLTQKELAKKLYMSVMTVRNCEEEKSFPRVDNLISFADFFGVSTDYLLGISDRRERL